MSSEALLNILSLPSTMGAVSGKAKGQKGLAKGESLEGEAFQNLLQQLQAGGIEGQEALVQQIAMAAEKSGTRPNVLELAKKLPLTEEQNIDLQKLLTESTNLKTPQETTISEILGQQISKEKSAVVDTQKMPFLKGEVLPEGLPELVKEQVGKVKAFPFTETREKGGGGWLDRMNAHFPGDVKSEGLEAPELLMRGQTPVTRALKSYQQEAGGSELSLIRNRMPQELTPTFSEERQESGDTIDLPNTLSIDGINGRQKAAMVSASGIPALDLSAVDASNPDALIEKIANHIEKYNLAGKEHLELIVDHGELGRFRMKVSRVRGGEGVDIHLRAAQSSARDFFIDNEAKLVQVLGRSGVQVGEIKIGSMSESSSSSFSQNSSGQEEGSGFGKGQQGQFQDRGRNQDSERRRQLWQTFKERYHA